MSPQKGKSIVVRSELLGGQEIRILYQSNHLLGVQQLANLSFNMRRRPILQKGIMATIFVFIFC